MGADIVFVHENNDPSFPIIAAGIYGIPAVITLEAILLDGWIRHKERIMTQIMEVYDTTLEEAKTLLLETVKHEI